MADTHLQFGTIKRRIRLAPDRQPKCQHCGTTLHQSRDDGETVFWRKCRGCGASQTPSATADLKSASVSIPAMPVVKCRARAFVYFALDASLGLVKIGFSQRPDGRLRELQQAASSALEMLCVVPETETLWEKQLHWRFSRLRVHGEWFRAEPELLDFIKELQGGE